MSNLRKLLDSKVEVSVQEFDHDGEKHSISGLPDSYVLDIQMMPANVRRSHATIWQKMLKDQGIDTTFDVVEGKDVEFDKVQQVFLVHHYLPPDEEGAFTLDFVAKMSATQGILFTKYFTSALKIVGSNSTGDVIDAVALKNSENKAESAPDSSKGA